MTRRAALFIITALAGVLAGALWAFTRIHLFFPS